MESMLYPLQDGKNLQLGGIIGDSDDTFCAFAAGPQNDCQVSIVDVVLTADPTDNISVWANFDWVNVNGNDNVDGNFFGAAAAGRVGLTDTIGFATRLEYVHTSNKLTGLADDSELFTVTGTLDKTLAEGLVTRMELRYDTFLDDNANGFTFNGDAAGTNDDQLVALWQMYYEF